MTPQTFFYPHSHLVVQSGGTSDSHGDGGFADIFLCQDYLNFEEGLHRAKKQAL